MTTRATTDIRTIAAARTLTVGEVEQLREFIRRHPELLPEVLPGQYDMQCLMKASEIITKKTRKLKR